MIFPVFNTMIRKGMAWGLCGLYCLTACHKTDNQVWTYGKMEDRSNIAGCTWVIALDAPEPDGVTMLEPLNIADFPWARQQGKAVRLHYEVFDGGTICMSGKPVKITRMEAR
jgi:hypothetical protein